MEGDTGAPFSSNPSISMAYFSHVGYVGDQRLAAPGRDAVELGAEIGGDPWNVRGAEAPARSRSAPSQRGFPAVATKSSSIPLPVRSIGFTSEAISGRYFFEFTDTGNGLTQETVMSASFIEGSIPPSLRNNIAICVSVDIANNNLTGEIIIDKLRAASKRPRISSWYRMIVPVDKFDHPFALITASPPELRINKQLPAVFGLELLCRLELQKILLKFQAK